MKYNKKQVLKLIEKYYFEGMTYEQFKGRDTPTIDYPADFSPTLNLRNRILVHNRELLDK